MNSISVKKLFVLLLAVICAEPSASFAQKSGDLAPANGPGFVAVMNMDLMILPGTAEYLHKTINSAAAQGAKILIVHLDTPGGMLPTSQQMIQEIFKSPIPIVVYVSPTGATATSAGVFITLAGHVAAMAPGTSIGAAHPVAGDGKDIEGDMRAKAENMTIAMVKSITDQRGRNAAWAEKAVKESSSITEREALKEGVVDVVAHDIPSLLKQIAGREVKTESGSVTLGDYSELPVRVFEMSFKQQTVNFFSNPNIAALLWLAATTGLSIELYNPGAILPGVVGIICLVLALAVSQIIPVTQVGIILLVLGAVLIASELFFTSGILGVGGVIAIIIGSIYLIDVSEAPGMAVSLQLIMPSAIILGGLMLMAVYTIISSRKRKRTTGNEGMIGLDARAMSSFSGQGRVFVNGEIWKADMAQGIADKGELLEVSAVKDGLVLEVRKKS